MFTYLFIFIYLLLFSFYLFLFSSYDNLKEYEPQQAVEMDAIETQDNWIESGNWRSNYIRGTEPPRYFGMTLAGQGEFPWIVDIRNNEPNQISAVGNLISNLWVLTACSIAKDWEKFRSAGQVVRYFETFTVSFCTNYIWEDYTRYDEQNEEAYHLYMGHDDAGSRKIVKVVKHRACNTMSRENNLLLVKVNNHIPVYVPVIGYMPLFGAPASVSGTFINFPEPTHLLLENMDGRDDHYRKMVCYVASFGRLYNSIPRPDNEDYKVKYRAYYSNYDYCARDDNYRLREALCSNNGNNPRRASDKSVVNEECLLGLDANGGARGQFVCFRTYAKHGAVCDHDHGAPLVCDGEVYGFVVRGVPPEYCVNSRMFPFIVMKVDILQDAVLYPQPPESPKFGSRRK